MQINRRKLLQAILQAFNTNNTEIHKELLSLWYKLILQESINNDFISEFYIIDTISEKTRLFYDRVI